MLDTERSTRLICIGFVLSTDAHSCVGITQAACEREIVSREMAVWGCPGVPKGPLTQTYCSSWGTGIKLGFFMPVSETFQGCVLTMSIRVLVMMMSVVPNYPHLQGK